MAARPAEASEFTYKYANNLPSSHPMNQRASQAADKIKAETNGRVQIDIFPNGELGSDTSMLSQLRSGAIEFFTLSGPILSILVPAASINGIGFAFTDYDAVWQAMDGDLGAYVRAEIEKADLIAMEKIWDNGFRQITSSSKPIATPDDLREFKNPRSGEPALDIDVQGLQCGADKPQLLRNLFRAEERSCRGPGEPAGGHFDGEALRGAEILLPDQPHVGRLLVPR